MAEKERMENENEDLLPVSAYTVFFKEMLLIIFMYEV